MTEVVGKWVERLKCLELVGKMTHWERMERAFTLQKSDFPPVAPELDYWQVTYAGYDHFQSYETPEVCTDSAIRTWYELRTDAIWMYVDISHQIENFIPRRKRPEHFVIRGPKDYVLFKPIAETLDQAIKLYEEKAYEKYLEDSRAATHYTPHMLQLLDFQEKMGRRVPVIVGAATPTNYAETIVEVQNFIKWLITEPKEKVKHYLELCLEERLEALEFYREYVYGHGCRFFCLWGGARTWGPKQLDEFYYVDEVFIKKASEIFPFVFLHHCGRNLPYAMERIAELPLKAVQYDMPYYNWNKSYSEWFEWVAGLFEGRMCAMNAPTTQLALHGTPGEVRAMVRDFLSGTLPRTTAVTMPGCELPSYVPAENVRAMIEATRESGSS